MCCSRESTIIYRSFIHCVVNSHTYEYFRFNHMVMNISGSPTHVLTNLPHKTKVMFHSAPTKTGKKKLY